MDCHLTTAKDVQSFALSIAKLFCLQGLQINDHICQRQTGHHLLTTVHAQRNVLVGLSDGPKIGISPPWASNGDRPSICMATASVGNTPPFCFESSVRSSEEFARRGRSEKIAQGRQKMMGRNVS